MKHKVHRLDINMESDPKRLEEFLNSLDGQVVSIIPNQARTTMFQIYGATRKVDFLWIVEAVE